MLSTIIVTKNDSKRLQKTLRSVSSQKVKKDTPWEVIIVDGNHRYDHKMSNFELPNGKKIIYLHVLDDGIFDAMNKGISRMKAEYAHFLNCGDTFYDSFVITKTIDLLNTSPGVPLFAWDFIYENQGLYSLKDLNITTILKGKSSYCHQAQIVHKDILLKYKFDSNLSLCADYLMTLNALLVSKFQHMNFIGVIYEGHGFSHNKESMIFIQKRTAIFRWIAVNGIIKISPKIAFIALSWNLNQLFSRLLRKYFL